MPEAVIYSNSLKSHCEVFLTPWEKRKTEFPFGEARNRIFIIFCHQQTSHLSLFPSSLQNLFLTLGSLPGTQVLRKTSVRGHKLLLALQGFHSWVKVTLSSLSCLAKRSRLRPKEGSSSTFQNTSRTKRWRWAACRTRAFCDCAALPVGWAGEEPTVGKGKGLGKWGRKCGENGG